MYYCFNSGTRDIYYLRKRKALVSVEGSRFKAFLSSNCLWVCFVINCPVIPKEMDQLNYMCCECTDTTQTYNNAFLSCNSSRISWLRPWVTAQLPSALHMAARALSAAFYLCKTTFSLSSAEHGPPPSILPDTFVQSGMASELPDVGGKTIGLNQPTSPYVSRPWEEFISERQEGAYIRPDNWGRFSGLSRPGQDIPGR